MLEVTNWNREKDSITYNFGYPILPDQNVPMDTEIEYKKLNKRQGLKAIYNGNYITSDRAWYALLNYANKNDISVEALPIEIFYNNPDMGGNALSWKTEVYLPVKSD
jgi:effector-binding domain-containing protein